ncbi:MAG: hypothetical protein K2J20_05580 [Bacilli bacterium]|nr:hypothetical protein [Bacilli bacterium]
MADLELKVIGLIKENYTKNDIIKTLNITPNMLWEILRDLKQKGFVYERKYYFDGSTIYVPTDNIQIPKNEVSIITTPED